MWFCCCIYQDLLSRIKNARLTLFFDFCTRYLISWLLLLSWLSFFPSPFPPFPLLLPLPPSTLLKILNSHLSVTSLLIHTKIYFPISLSICRSKIWSGYMSSKDKDKTVVFGVFLLCPLSLSTMSLNSFKTSSEHVCKVHSEKLNGHT